MQNVVLLRFKFYIMISYLPLFFIFLIAFPVGLLVGKLLFSSSFKTEIAALQEKINGLNNQIIQQKDQFESSKLNYEKQVEQERSAASKLLLQSNLEKEAIRNEKDALTIQLTKKETDFENLWERNKEQKQEVNELQEKFTKEFENLANKILEEKTNKFTEQNKENLKTILSPLQDKILSFEKKVEDTHKESLVQHTSLKEQIIYLGQMNAQMSKETLNLTKALKGDSKMQGNWGELILERVLEKSGLEKNREYFVQLSHETDEGNRVFPDVVINLPDGKKMIVDSKVTDRKSVV